MAALYAFARKIDDLADETGTAGEQRNRLTLWRRALTGGIESFDDEILPALNDTVRRFAIPRDCFTDLLDGAESDLIAVRINTWAELDRYCRNVATSVGRACLRIWGCTRFELADPLAHDAGVAFQLTNIIRDLREDHERGRCYLPADDLNRFHLTPETWALPESRNRLHDLLALEIDRNRAYYSRARDLLPLIPTPGRTVFRLMLETYSTLLETIARDPLQVLDRRVRVSRFRKAILFARAWWDGRR